MEGSIKWKLKEDSTKNSSANYSSSENTKLNSFKEKAESDLSTEDSVKENSPNLPYKVNDINPIIKDTSENENLIREESNVYDNEKQKSQKKNVDVNEENKPLNLFCDSMSLFGCSAFLYMAYKYSTFWEERKEIIPSGIVLPSVYDFRLALYSMIIITIFKLIIETASKPIIYKLADSKHIAKDNSPEALKLEKVFIKRMSTNIFKLTYFLTVVILGHFVVVNIEFFPKLLFAKGDLLELFKERPELNLPEGTPSHLFFTKPDYFNIYYMTTLAYSLVDFIWLLFINERGIEFETMRLHHICTITLVSFSYLTNGSHVGIIIFYLHDLTDIMVYLCKIVISLRISDAPKLVVCAMLLLSFLVYRMYLFGYIIYAIIMYLNYWHIFNCFLIVCLCLLFVLHCWWIYCIIKRFFYMKIEDIGKVKAAKNK